MKEINKFEPKTESVLVNHVCHDFKVSNNILISLSTLTDLDPKEAILHSKEAQDNHSYDLIWQLAEVYFEDITSNAPRYDLDIDLLYDFLTDISEDNPHYKLAQDMCVDLLMLVPIEKGNDEERIKYLELKFRHALAGTRLDLANLLYSDLCGSKFPKEVKGNADTLIAIAKKMRFLNQKVKDLENKNKQTETEITDYKLFNRKY